VEEGGVGLFSRPLSRYMAWDAGGVGETLNAHITTGGGIGSHGGWGGGYSKLRERARAKDSVGTGSCPESF
jgi:hypothetical protein